MEVWIEEISCVCAVMSLFVVLICELIAVTRLVLFAASAIMSACWRFPSAPYRVVRVDCACDIASAVCAAEACIDPWAAADDAVADSISVSQPVAVVNAVLTYCRSELYSDAKV